MYSGRPGDIRGMAVIMGCTGLGIVGLASVQSACSITGNMQADRDRRLAQILLPKPWRVYADRLEFTCVAMLWICWTCKFDVSAHHHLEKH